MAKSDETRKRLLEAAMAEFSSFGLAGGRVDRIAAAAACNKQAIYAYFGSKENLFDAVYEAMVASTVKDVPIDGLNLSGYAIRLFDRYVANPSVMRLATWYALERGAKPPKFVLRAAQQKIAAIEAAQHAGSVTMDFNAEDLLTLIVKISTVAPYSPAASQANDRSKTLRQSISIAVERLIAP